ncbi:MAG: hypothetical protein KGL29_05005 [Alphaproteobacteria bacterium]|nr:hypothetical protein [Alphaproteobacteria bacterium]
MFFYITALCLSQYETLGLQGAIGDQGRKVSTVFTLFGRQEPFRANAMIQAEQLLGISRVSDIDGNLREYLLNRVPRHSEAGGRGFSF